MAQCEYGGIMIAVKQSCFPIRSIASDVNAASPFDLLQGTFSPSDFGRDRFQICIGVTRSLLVCLVNMFR